MALVALGIGTNLGNRIANLKQAIHYICVGEWQLLDKPAISPIYESKPLLPENSPADWNIKFYNIAVTGQCSLDPQEALSRIHSIESHIGRVRKSRWEPRIIDIDILAWEGVALDDDNLKIPHPGLASRAFAIFPLADLNPEWDFSGISASELAKQVKSLDNLGTTRLNQML